MKKIHNHIIVKFVCCDVHEDIYKKRQKLNGKFSSCLPSVNAQLGNSIAQPKKIFVNESLTGYRKQLFSNVQEYQRCFGYKFLWTVNKGKILLRQAQFQLCKDNLKSTWKLTGTLINCKSKGQSSPSRIARNNKGYSPHNLILWNSLTSILSMWAVRT